MALAKKVAGSSCTVLITGESGTGKELVARVIHDTSPSRSGQYIPINVAALPSELVESQLFGHIRGAFTGADQDKALAGLTIAATAASMGMEVTLFFTFWGINVLKEKRMYSGKDIKEKMIDFMTPTGAGHMGVSKLNMMGEMS